MPADDLSPIHDHARLKLLCKSRIDVGLRRFKFDLAVGRMVRSVPWLEDPAAADDLVAIVEDGGLVGRDGALRLVKNREDFPFEH